jgi:hypothetical protein
LPDAIRRIDYYYVSVPDKPGEGARILSALHQAGINLLGVSAFPHGARKSQLDLIPDDSASLAKAAKSAGLMLSKKKSGFLIQGEDRPGVIRHHEQARPSEGQHHVGASFLRRRPSVWRHALGQAGDLRKAAKALAAG